MTDLEKIEIIPNLEKTYNKVIIMLHGLGASGDDFLNIPNLFNFPEEWKIKYIFPHAPIIPVTINNHLAMPAWYNIESINFTREYQKETLTFSLHLLKKIVESEINQGIKSENIIIGGFSQGGATSFALALFLNLPLAGIFILSAYILNQEKTMIESSIVQKTPIFMAHGKYDNVVDFKLAEMSKDFLLNEKCSLIWRTYDIDHSISNQEIKDLNNWMIQNWKE